MRIYALDRIQARRGVCNETMHNAELNLTAHFQARTKEQVIYTADTPLQGVFNRYNTIADVTLFYSFKYLIQRF